MNNPFFYMFKDKYFLLKAAILWCVLMLCIMSALFSVVLIKKGNYLPCILLMLACSLISFIISGYLTSCTQSIIKNGENVDLPYINPLSDLVKGLKYFIGNILFSIICGVIFGILSLIPGVNIIVGIASFLLQIVVSSLSFAFLHIFAKTEKIFSCFMFPTAFRIIGDNVGKYIVSLLLCFACSIILIAVCVAAAVLTGVGASVASSFIAPNSAMLLTRNIAGISIMFIVSMAAFTHMTYVITHLIANCSDARVEDTII